uniref:No apical meristem-associated C-terminal domain-containing protein n=1 Tax=Tanacetum cinerariifolium TaxID=118510 RepID=A0A6L2MEW7_TANCI|nr:hypothetical protein [Tanacetum cinerariifolium]
MGGSSSQPQSSQPHSFQDNTGYWQEPNPHESPVEQVTTLPTKKKATRNRQNRLTQTGDAPRQTAWTTKEEIALDKGWHFVSENSEHGNARKKDSFGLRLWITYRAKQKWKVVGRTIWWWENRSLKFQEMAFSNFNQGSEGSSKRHKSSGSSLFNTESGDASINLNNTVAGDDEVQEIRRPGGRDKARVAAKNKRSKALRSSTMNDDALARLVVNEMTAAEVEQRKAFI